MRIFVTGQSRFGSLVARRIVDDGHDLLGVSSPATGSRGGYDELLVASADLEVPWIDSSGFGASTLPASIDVLVAAHSHAFVGRRTRSLVSLASIGYHPSLLPLHRGRDAIRWTVRDRDRVCGGSVYHLTDTVDGGPIAAQEWAFVPRHADARSLWREILMPMGVELVAGVVNDLARGHYVAVDQDEDLATWEPSWERPPLFRPELIELGPAPGGVTYVTTTDALHRFTKPQ